MGFTPETIDHLIELGAPNIADFDGLKYTDKPLTVIAPPMKPCVKVVTLSGLADCLSAMETDAKAAFIQIEGPLSVSVQDIVPDAYGRRQMHIHANGEGQYPKFQFGEYLTPEQFQIQLRTRFVPTTADDFEYVLTVASKVIAGTAASAEDNGIAQSVVLRKEMSFKEGIQLRGIVSLTPYRTFPEVDQPTSQFLFRAKAAGPDQPPNLALFEADGGMWKVAAAKNIAAWLEDNTVTTNFTVIR